MTNQQPAETCRDILAEADKQALIDTCQHMISRKSSSEYSDNLREVARIALAALTDGVKLPPLNDELIAILGRPNFGCADIAQLLRRNGMTIAYKAENEQAAAIHFLLGHYLQHGEDWRATASEALNRMAS